MAVRSALALREQFHVHDQVLERVDVFEYLGRLLAQDDDDVQAVRAQICKARATWVAASDGDPSKDGGGTRAPMPK
jgi:hypothetical protein